MKNKCMKQLDILSKLPRIAIISDIHGDLAMARQMASFLERESVDTIILAGDIPDDTKTNFKKILSSFNKLDIPTIVFPGSHENSFTYESTLKEFNNSSSLIDASKRENQHIRLKEHDLFIIPGSHVVSAGSTSYKGGNMWLLDKRRTPQAKARLTRRAKKLKFAHRAKPFFLPDSKMMIAQSTMIPRKNQIIICHEPPLCRTERGIDNAHFARPSQAFTINNEDIKNNPGLKEFKSLCREREISEHSVFPLEEGRFLHKIGYPIEFDKKNVGSQGIREILERYSITKCVSGHIHEAGPEAIDKNERRIRKGKWKRDMYINNGPGNEGHLTLLTLRSDGVTQYHHKKLKK